jgi:hypothetical protein
MAKTSKGVAATTVGRPKGTTVGRAVAPGNFTFSTNKAGVGPAGRSANVGSRPMGIKVGRNKKGK